MGLDPNVTLRSLSLGSRDATTGQREKSFSESTIKAVGTPRGATFSLQGVGVYAREDRLFTAAAPANIYDQILDGTKYYEIKTKQQFKILDSHLFYAYQCSELPMWQGAVETATWKTDPNDPRERTKTWIDSYIRNAQITKNDGATEASWACLFKNPLYPLALEYRGASNMNGLYPVGQPVTTPLIDSDSTVYGYIEEIPIFTDTIDSTDCGGDQLLWKMEAELRYVFQNHPEGSYRGPQTRRPNLIDLGSTRLYEVESSLRYERDLT